MAEEQDDGEKTEEPSAYRIEEFRKRGEVASSKDLVSVAVLTATVFTLGISLLYIYEELSVLLEWLYALNPVEAFTPVAQKTIITKVLTTFLSCIGPICFSAAVVGVLAHVGQFGFIFSTETLSLKPERLNPVEGIKRLFSFKATWEAIKALFKFIVIMAIIYYYVKDDLETYRGFLNSTVIGSFLYGKELIIKIAFAIILGLALIALGDFAYQKYSYHQKLMQTKYGAKQELKEQEGSPEIKQRIRTIQREISNKRMMQKIPEADVVVTNPTHLSVALKYDKATMASPIIIAKGSDFMAMRIREIAKAHNVPLVENVPLARAMYKTLKVGESIPHNLYKAVAEVLAFVYRLKRKQKALSLN